MNSLNRVRDGRSPFPISSRHEGNLSKQPLHPDEAKGKVDVIFAEAFYTGIVGRGVSQIEQPVEILLYDNIAEVDWNRAHQAQFIFAPQGAGDVPDARIEGIGSANFETGSAGTAVDQIEVGGYRMAVIAKGADYDMDVVGPCIRCFRDY